MSFDKKGQNDDAKGEGGCGDANAVGKAGGFVDVVEENEALVRWPPGWFERNGGECVRGGGSSCVWFVGNGVGSKAGEDSGDGFIHGGQGAVSAKGFAVLMVIVGGAGTAHFPFCDEGI